MTTKTDVNHIVAKDIETEMLELDLLQFLDLPNMDAMTKIMAKMNQEVYDVFLQLAEGFLLDNAIGSQLDIIGSILGTPRINSDDDAYRTVLKIRGYRTRTHGTRSEIIDISSRFTGVDPSGIDTYTGGNKSVDIAFFTGCLDQQSAARELTKIFPVVTNYRLVSKAGSPFTFTSLYTLEPDNENKGFSSVFDNSYTTQGGRLGSLIAVNS